ncbi:aminoglycoside phosphotransferase [Pseudactinotalea suaedae]|uniref:aminoglycoside phosphotransferase n=1 Tax=Pseudactinotalea suaedae TaxID=1524924 RepID=UPI0012E13B48|nr:aminoglycoside phosphotransferase [Pseudactinotalea suaedae]
MHPTDHVLDLFAVPGGLEPLAGGQGGSFRAGDLVLSPGRDAAVHDLLSPVIARLAVDLDTRAGRDRQDLRIAMPIPARDGSWVVDGWGASRFEDGAQLLVDLEATLAVAAVLHAELAERVRDWPLAHQPPRDRWAAADRIAFGEAPGDAEAAGPGAAPLVRWLLDERDLDADLGASQLVDGDLAGNVLLDADGAPVVIDIAPYWRPPLWAEATCVLDSVMWWGADPDAMVRWREGAPRQAMIRAALFRVLSDRPDDTAVFERALAPLSPALR